MKKIQFADNQFRSIEALHEYLANQLELPEQFGMDLNLLMDMLMNVCEETEVHIIETGDANIHLRLDFEKVITIFTQVEQENNSLAVAIERRESADETDKLTGAYSGWKGKILLKASLDESKEKKKVLSVCILDVNAVKMINDTYGYPAGDKLLCTIVDVIRAEIREQDYVARLSGDEFLVVFTDTYEKEACDKMKIVLQKLQMQELFPKENRKSEFCFGMFEVIPGKGMQRNEVLRRADERLYEQKKNYHICQADERLHHEVMDIQGTEFDYDESRLYDALLRSTDDYIYICNMETGTFCYPQSMVDEFGNDVKELLESGECKAAIVMKLNVDDFKKINHLYNLRFGDEVIRIIAQRIQSLLPANAMAYRLDGDEFGILLRDGHEAAVKFYNALQKEFSSQQQFENQKFCCGCGGTGSFLL